MKGLFLVKPGYVELIEMPKPTIDENEVLIRVRACSICGGDIKIYKNKDLAVNFPYFMGGHEWSGEVVEVGSNVKDFKIGDRVARCFNNYCGFCVNCRVGSPNFCTGIKHREHSGGFAEYVSFYIPPNGGKGLYKIPEELKYEDAALAEPGTCAIRAVLRGNPQAEEFITVLGLGGLGQLIAQRLCASGAIVIGIDVNDSKLEKASPWCKYLINSSKEDPVEKVLKITSGIGADKVYEVVGIEDTWIQAVEMIRLGGILVMVGVVSKPTTKFNLDRIFRKDITVIPSKGPFPLLTPQGEPMIWNDMKRGIIRPEEIYKLFTVDKANGAFEAQAYGNVPKAVMKF